jgi:hypothetical protein
MVTAGKELHSFALLDADVDRRPFARGTLTISLTTGAV